MQVPTSEKWRDANKPVKTVFGLNPSLLIIFMITIFCFHIWTVILCVLLTIFFAAVEYKGVPGMMALRWIRTQITKRKKIIRPWWIL